MAIYLTELDETFNFPSPYKALSDPNGLLAFGGDLNPMRILNGYYQGIFPWYGPGEPIYGGALLRALCLTHCSLSHLKVSKNFSVNITIK